jgi:DNA-binding MarR family transcriptional regulator
MSPPSPTLGTLLRILVDLLDGAVEESYRNSGLDYRPRYTPVVRTLLELGPSTIRIISRTAGLTHSAISQTVEQMRTVGLVAIQPGRDGRERIVALTPMAEAMIPVLQEHWAATNAAARALEEEVSVPLAVVLFETIGALERRSFSTRIEQAKATLQTQPSEGVSHGLA